MYPNQDAYYSLGSLYADVHEGEEFQWKSADLRAASFFQTSVRGKTPYALFDHDSADTFMEQYALAVKSKTERSFNIEFRRGRTRKNIRITIIPLVDDTFNVLQVICNLYDVAPPSPLERDTGDRTGRLPVLNGTQDLVWEWTVRTGEIRLSGKLKELFGGSGIEPAQTLETWLRRIHKDDVARVTAALHRCRAGSGSYDEVYRMQRNDGSFFICRDTLINVTGTTEEIRTIVGSITDITEQKTKEESLQQVIDTYKTLIESTSDCYIECDANGRIRSVNSKGALHFGISTDRMTGRWIDDFFYFTDVTALNEWLSRVTSTEQRGFELRTVRGGRLRAVMRCSTIPTWDETHAPAGFVLVAMDVSEQHRTLHDYRAVFETSRNGIVLYQGGKIILMNKAAARHFGASFPEHFHERSVLDLLHPVNREEASRYLVPDNGGIEFATIPIFKGLRVDGSTFDLEISVSVLRYGDDPTFMLTTRDVTDRRLAYTLLEQSEAFFRTLIEHSADFIALVDGQGKTVYVNPAGKNILGYEQEYFLNRNPLQFVHPEDRLRSNRALATIMQKKEPITLICRIANLAGEWVEFEALVVPLIGSNAQITQYFISARDISARKKAEQMIEQSERRYQSLFSSATDGLFIYNTAGIITDVNQSGCMLFGYAREELVGRSIHMLLFPDDPQINTDSYQIISNPQPVFRRMRRKDMSEIWIQWTTSVFESSGDLALLVDKRDVTLEHRLRSQLEYASAFQQAVIESFDPIRVIDTVTWSVISSNSAAERFYSDPSRTGAALSCPHVANHAETCAEEDCPLHLAMRFHEPVPIERYVEEEDRWFLVSGYPFSVTGHLYIAEVVRDITRRKRMEQIGAWNQRMEAVGELAEEVSETFKEVLGNLFGFASHARLKLDKNDKLLSAVDSLEKSAEKAVRLNEDLQQLTSAGRSRPTLVLLGEVVDSVLPLVQRTLPQMTKVRKDIARDLLPIAGERRKLEHAVLNACLYLRDAWIIPSDQKKSVVLKIGAANRTENGRTAGKPWVQLTLTCTGTISADAEKAMQTPGESEETGSPYLPVVRQIVGETGGEFLFSIDEKGVPLITMNFSTATGEADNITK